jgi:ABC-2 type transport system ATP-binding protein
MNIISASNIVKKYADHLALNDVSIDIPKGSVFGLLGPNGAGKTSFIRIINQITGPDEGLVLFNDEKLKRSDVEKIGYLPEERGLYKKMEVGEQCIYLAQLKGLSLSEAKKRLKYWFEKFEIQNWWNKKVEDLSKGMAQKVQFIVTVIHEPELLILDEPFSGFDPINSNLIRDEILELNKKGITIIFSTHNMTSVEEMCSHIALINNARKVLDGEVGKIKNSYKKNIYEIGFEGEMIGFTNAMWTGFELLDEKIEKLPFETYNKVKVKMIDHDVNELLKRVMAEVKIKYVKEDVPNMNQIFIEAVKNK